jgi:microcystin-dependent protein
MATTLNAGTTTATALNVITDTTGAMAIQTSGTTAIAISSAQVVTLTNPLAAGSGGTGVSSLGTGVATFLGTPSSANLAAAVTDETGTGSLVFADSPTLSGTPLAPTAAVSTDSTQIATTAFVRDIIPTGIISLWSGSIASIPSGWLICDGTSGTPDLRGRFIVGGGTYYAVGATGGSADATLPQHNHSITDPGHAHSYEVSTTAAAILDGGSNAQLSRTSTSTGTATTGITINNSGSSATNANLPPYYALAYIMKA